LPGSLGQPDRAWLVTVVVRDYPDDHSDQFVKGIDGQLEALQRMWCAPDLGGRALAAKPPIILGHRDDVEDAIRTAGLRDLGEDDAFVVYVAGHGLVGGSGHRHYLMLPGSDHTRLPVTAYPTADLVAAVLGSRARHVLVIVNSCFAGTLAKELTVLREDLDAARRTLPTLGVFLTADFDQRPRVGEFAHILTQLDRQLRGPSQYADPYLTLDQFHQELARAAATVASPDRGSTMPLRVLPVVPGNQATPCLPNPGYQPVPHIVSPARREVADTGPEVEYWLGRASGRTSDTDTGWYFTGRSGLISEATAFLHSDDDVLIVTGAAGSGKSAVLARMVTLSDPSFRRDPRYRHVIDAASVPLPEEGSVDAAVLARNKDVEDVAAALLTALGIDAAPVAQAEPDTAAWRKQIEAHIIATGRRHTLVVDGVDEARAPQRLLVELLGPLARLDRRPIRLIVGMRSPTPARTGPETSALAGQGESGLLTLFERLAPGARIRQLRTDGPEAIEDIRGYVQALLTHPGTRYDSDPPAQRALATAVAARVNPSFLDARLAGQRLRDSSQRQDPADPAWLSTLDSGTAGLLREDLADVATPDHPTHHLLAVLRAVGYAAGAGLPWSDVWPTIAQAVHGEPLADPDAAIRRVLHSRLAGYFSRDMEDGHVVYRLAHERLAQLLRGAPRRLITDRPDGPDDAGDGLARRRIADALRDLAQASLAAGYPPHPYLRRHLVRHAADAGMLDDDHVPAQFLPWETSGQVRARLGLPATPAPGRVQLAAWAAIEPYLADADQESRSLSLTFASRAITSELGRPEDQTASGSHPLPLRWARWRLTSNTLVQGDSIVDALTLFKGPDGRTLLAAGDDGGTLRIWDPATGTLVGDPLVGHGAGITAVTAFVSADGQTLLATGSTDRTVRFWDPAAVTEVGEPWTGHGDWIPSVAGFVADGRPLIAASAGYHFRIWDPASQVEIPVKNVHRGGTMLALIAFSMGQRTLLASLGGGELTVWEPATGRRIRNWDVHVWRSGTNTPGGERALTAFADSQGRTLLATTYQTRSARIWDAATGNPVGEPLVGHSEEVIAAASFTANDGRVCLVTGSDDCTVRIWDPTSGAEVGLIATDHPVHSLAVKEGGIAPLLITGCSDAAIRIWDLTAALDPRTQRSTGLHTTVRYGTTLVANDDNALFVAAGRDGGLAVWDAVTGTPVRPLVTDTREPIRALTSVRDPHGRVLLATADTDGIRIWDPIRGSEVAPLISTGTYGRSAEGHPVAMIGQALHWVNAMTELIRPDDYPLLATGGHDGTVRIWDPNRRAEISRPLTYQRPFYINTGDGYLSPANIEVCALASFTLDDHTFLVVGGEEPMPGSPNVVFWDTVTGDQVAAIAQAHKGSVNAVAAFRGKGDRLLVATAGSDSNVYVWDFRERILASGPLRHGGPVQCLTTFIDETGKALLASGATDCSLRIWDPLQASELTRIVLGARIQTLAVIPHLDAKTATPVNLLIAAGPAGIAAFHADLRMIQPSDARPS
jgi:WD40 repeat protein